MWQQKRMLSTVTHDGAHAETVALRGSGADLRYRAQQSRIYLKVAHSIGIEYNTGPDRQKWWEVLFMPSVLGCCHNPLLPPSGELICPE